VEDVRYRVEDLAARSGVSVDTVRFYQARGLLPRPQRDGRVAWYTETHVERLDKIRELKAQGLPLAVIRRALDGGSDPAGQALVRALAQPLADETSREEPLDRAELEARTGVPRALLDVLEREGLLVPNHDGERPYTDADVAAVQAGLSLLETGVPLSELLALAREHDQAMRAVADRAVELFARYVRDPARRSAESDVEAAERVVNALRAMLPATAAVVSHHFRRRLLAAAWERIDGHPTEVEGQAG